MNSGKKEPDALSRRLFLKSSALGAAGLGISQFGCSNGKNSNKSEAPKIQGFEDTSKAPDPYKGWVSFSERKIRVGLVGHGVCKFASQFGFQNHPNVEVVAVSDLIPERCAEMAKPATAKRLIRRLKNL